MTDQNRNLSYDQALARLEALGHHHFRIDADMDFQGSRWKVVPKIERRQNTTPSA